MADVVGSRLAELIDQRRTSQSALARLIGISQPSIGRLISGETRETGKLLELARALQTSPEYLVGETDNPDANALIDRSGPMSGMTPRVDPDVVELAEIDLRYGLGGTFVDAPVVETKRQFSRSWLRQFTRAAPEQLFWALGYGDSMEPTIRSGELILIDRSEQIPRAGDGICAFAWGDIGMVKRLRPLPDGKVEILSDNPLVPPATAVGEEIHMVGRVVAVVRKL